MDDMQAPFMNMVMCHMVADTTEELFYMADRIGVRRKWVQDYGTHREHFDICLTKRAIAVRLGAKEITMRELAAFTQLRKQLTIPMRELTPFEIEQYLSAFTPIYTYGKEENPIPEGVKLTVYVKSSTEEGYLENVYSHELGLEALIARSWIRHDELLRLVESVG